MVYETKVKSLSRVRLIAIPWTVARQAPLPMGFSRQEYWSGEPLPSPNITTVMEFILLGFSDIPNFQWILLGIFLVLYLTILMCNNVIVLITRIDPTLQTPMYFFLNHFSILEICYVTVTIPRMLTDLLNQKGHVSFIACAAQMCLVLLFGGLGCLLLVMMAYDCYVAICNPLHHGLIKSPQVCVQLVTASWVSGVPVVIGQT